MAGALDKIGYANEYRSSIFIQIISLSLLIAIAVGLLISWSQYCPEPHWLHSNYKRYLCRAASGSLLGPKTKTFAKYSN